MRCSKCEHRNPEAAKFCTNCGAFLEVICSNCGYASSPQRNFCMECGEPIGLVDDVSESPTQSEVSDRRPSSESEDRKDVSDAERRQLTVMFCDLVGSTALSERLDPEDLSELLLAYREAASGAIRKYEGHIARYLGDGLLVYFGYPEAHEDDARRAVHAGLGLIEAIKDLNIHLKQEMGIELLVRVGVHTGLVVAGDLAGEMTFESESIVGETPNIAARLEGIAPVNSVVLSSSTYNLVHGYFSFSDLGTHQVKGINEPLPVFQVVREGESKSRFEVSVSTGLTPLVGREREIDLLLDYWTEAEEGRARVLLIGGEAGIGKSRLLMELKGRLSGIRHKQISGDCSPYHQNSPFHPLIDLIGGVFHFRDADSPAEKLHKLESVLTELGSNDKDDVPLLSPLFSIPLPESYPELAVSPEWQKKKILDVLVSIVLNLAKQEPLVMIIEDLHWIDSSSLEFIELLVKHISATHIYLIMTYRPDEFEPPWRPQSNLIFITLNRLVQRQTQTMIKQLAQGRSLPADILDQIVTKTDGVPLFVEEFLKTVLESDILLQDHDDALQGELPSLEIPTTLQDSLMARLDRLATVKEVAQLTALLGREFSFDLISAVWTGDEEVLLRDLGQLVRAEILYQKGIPPNSIYVFKHALIQEAASGSLLKRKRQRLHLKIARTLEAQFPDIVEMHPELIAHHHTAAGQNEQAIPYWQRASQLAIDQSAYSEAMNHIRSGLALLELLSDKKKQEEYELELFLLLGKSLSALKGEANSEVEQVYGKAYEMSARIGDPIQKFVSARGLSRCYFIGARLHEAEKMMERLQELALDTAQEDLICYSHLALAGLFNYMGDLVQARIHIAKASALTGANTSAKTGSDLYFLHYMRIGLLMNEAQCAGLQGKFDQCTSAMQKAIKYLQGVNEPTLEVAATITAAGQYNALREWECARKYSSHVIKISSEHGLSYWLPAGRIHEGYTMMHEGEITAGVEQMIQGIEDYRSTGGRLVLPSFLWMLAKGQLRLGNDEQAEDLVQEALRLIDETGEAAYKAGLHIVEAEILEIQGRSDESIVSCIQDAIGFAQERGHKVWELRAIIYLAQVWKRIGKEKEAFESLSTIYESFTEGFDVADLREARALLRQLSESE